MFPATPPFLTLLYLFQQQFDGLLGIKNFHECRESIHLFFEPHVPEKLTLQLAREHFSQFGSVTVIAEMLCLLTRKVTFLCDWFENPQRCSLLRFRVMTNEVYLRV